MRDLSQTSARVICFFFLMHGLSVAKGLDADVVPVPIVANSASFSKMLRFSKFPSVIPETGSKSSSISMSSTTDGGSVQSSK